MIYEFKGWARDVPPDAKAEEVAEALIDIKSRYGKLTDGIVADEVESDPNQHPLRGWFTWDPELGMRKLHVIEAGNVIRVVAVKEIRPRQSTPVRAFVVTSENGERTYEHISVVLQDDDQKRQLVQQVRQEKHRFDTKLEELLTLIELL